MVLVFLGTLDQVNIGVHEVQKRYFESFIALWRYPLEWPGSQMFKHLIIPIPGGYLLGCLLLVNLICAHFHYFVPSKKKIGITIIHAGLVLLLVSGFMTSFFQKESQMLVNEGSKTNYSENFRDNELVIIDKSDELFDHVTSLSTRNFNEGKTFQMSSTPIRVKVDKFYSNAEIGLRVQNPEGGEPDLATSGAGAKMGLVVFPKPKSYAEKKVNAATAYVTIYGEETILGTWLVSNIIDNKFPPQKFSYNGRDYEVALRFKRTYMPFDIELIDFTFDRYPGTQIAKNFSSLIKVHNHSMGENRQVLVYMNHPLRYGGYTFYQASYGENEHASIFQVVQNPSWLLPYLAVIFVGLGLVVHFVMHLALFLRKEHA